MDNPTGQWMANCSSSVCLFLHVFLVHFYLAITSMSGEVCFIRQQALNTLILGMDTSRLQLTVQYLSVWFACILYRSIAGFFGTCMINPFPIVFLIFVKDHNSVRTTIWTSPHVPVVNIHQQTTNHWVFFFSMKITIAVSNNILHWT